MKVLKSLGKSFDRQVFGIIHITHHLQDHMIDRLLVPIHQHPKSGLIPFQGGLINQLKILKGLIRKLAF